MTNWYPDGDQNDGFTRNGFVLAKALEQVLRKRLAATLLMLT